LVAGQSLAQDLSNAAFEKPDLSQSAESAPAMFSSGLLGEDDVSSPETKSVSKAVLYSLLLPGLGQRYLGETTSSRVFFILDVAIWTSFVVFTVQADQREDSYQEYARTFAGVTQLDHSDDYYSVLTRYNTSGDYESDIKSEGRLSLYPDVDVAALDEYFMRNRVSDYEMWLWKSADHRRAYQDIRSASKRADQRALYSLAAAVANRVTSGFFAYRSASRQKKENAQETSYLIELGAPQRRASEGFQTGVSFIRNF